MNLRAVLICVFLVGRAAGAEASALFDLERSAFHFLWFQTHPDSGLVKDRARNQQRDTYTVSSIAATGFGLAALPIGVEREWIERERAEERAKTTLRTFSQMLTNQHGWFYHFVDWQTGERQWKCEVSSIDTTWFVTGALLAGEYFGGETREMAQKLYRNVDFEWMLTDGGARPEEKTLSMGWRPESGFIKARWDTYSEHLALGILAMGSPTHAIGPETWKAWKRNVGEYKGHKTFACGPLFTHQYSQAFIDFRGKKDALGFDYFESAVQATLANQQFCIDQSGEFGYGTNVWGLSACDKPFGGYEAYGAPPGEIHHDGTVSPWNTAASVAFTPDLVIAAVNHMRKEYPQISGRFGFYGAFNLKRNWVAPDIVSIDAGAALLMIENYRSEFVWREFMKIDAIQRGMAKAGFKEASELRRAK